MTICRFVIVSIICYFTAVIPHHSFALQQIRKQQQQIQIQKSKNKGTTNKTHDKFVNWADNTASTYYNNGDNNEQRHQEEHKDEVENSLALPPPLRLLVVDGNNVRGIGKFELNPLELQHQVVRFCYKYRIPNVMIVWDHGSEKFACTQHYNCSSNNNNNNNNNSSNSNNFTVNINILFSGLRQRADDVIVAESKHLISLSSSSSSSSSSSMDWSSMAFVTNDRELNYKLRRQSISTTVSNNNEPSTIRFSRRKRAKGFAVTTDTKRLLLDSDNDNGGDDNNSNNSNNDNGIYHNRNITSDTIETNKYSDSSKSFNKKECPMFCDSTGFVKLLEELPKYNNSDDDNIGISIVTDNYYDQRTLTSLKETKESIVRFIKLSNQQQSRGGGGGYKLNPRREKTWERCIQAEIFRRSLLLQQQQQQQQQQSSLSTPSSQDDNVLFFTKYLEELQVERGYHNHRHSNLSPVNSIDNNDGDGIENDNDNDSNTFQPFQGPSRLDKRERRLLDRYNSLLKKGEIP